MTITPFRKITIFGTAQQDRDHVLAQLQTMGCMHLIAINPKKSTNLTTTATTLFDQIKKALFILKYSPEQAKPKELDEKFDADKIVQAILTNDKHLREAIDRQDFLTQRIKDLSPWGQFHFPEKTALDNNLLWFYKIKHKDASSIPNNFTVQEVHRDNQFIYLVVISPQEPPHSAFPAPRVHTGAVPLNELVQELKQTQQNIDNLTEKRRYLTRYRWLLNDKLANFADKTKFQEAKQKTHDLTQFYAIQGWVPEAELSKVETLVKDLNLALTIEPVSPGEKAPTQLKTYSWATGGVEIINFYQLPGYNALDPSLMVFFSFSVFFAMILADAGYGIVIALFTLLGWKSLGKSKSTWLRPLLVTLSIFSIIYGIMVGSYFGYEPPETSFWHHFVVFHINDFNTMMKVAIFVGCVHVMAANAMRGWYAKHLHVKIESIGFIFVILGFMVLAYALMHKLENLTSLATGIIVLSLLTIAIFASDIPVTNFKSFIKRTLKGLLSLAEITALFSDILSYLRLFALGLAGASLAITINQIAGNLYASSSYGWIFAILVLLFGQTLNFALCIMSALIHGLRLNYIEFFKWSIKEEGYAYEPLKKTEVSHE